MRRLISLALATVFLSLALLHPLAHPGGHPDDSCVTCQAQRDPITADASPAVLPPSVFSRPVSVRILGFAARSRFLAPSSRAPPAALPA